MNRLGSDSQIFQPETAEKNDPRSTFLQITNFVKRQDPSASGAWVPLEARFAYDRLYLSYQSFWERRSTWFTAAGFVGAIALGVVIGRVTKRR